METQRQKKIAGLIQQDLAEILQRAVTDSGLQGIIVSVSKVAVTPDLSQAKVYVSVFPSAEAKPVIKGIQAGAPAVKHQLAQRVKNQLRRVPELSYFHDDSLDYIEDIERTLKKGDNPIENRDLLDRRKKS